MKSDGSYYNKMTSMLVEGRTSRVFPRLGSLYFYDFGILINLCCITDSANICLMRESIRSSPVVCTFVVKGVAEFDRLQSAKMTPSRSSSTDGYISPQQYRVFWGF